MDPQRKSLRMGAAIIGAAVLLRLLSGGILAPLIRMLTQPETVAVLMYLETGRVVRPYNTMTYPAESPGPEMTQPPEATPPIFTRADGESIRLDNETGYAPDISALLTAPLKWQLDDGIPRVLILHTHGTESYNDTNGYRSTDETQNMLSVGDRLTARLEEAGISALHDRTLHDEVSYNGSYTLARQTIEQYLIQYPSIRLVLDLHRDAAEDDAGNQINYTVTAPAGKAAKLMLVMGTDAGGFNHPNWAENMALAVKLQATLEKIQPGICRPVYVRTSRFNQDLSPGALLIEVGAAGNSRQEALLATDILAQAIIALAHGANTEPL